MFSSGNDGAGCCEWRYDQLVGGTERRGGDSARPGLLMYMVIHRVNGQSHKDITSRHRHPGVTKRALSTSHRE